MTKIYKTQSEVEKDIKNNVLAIEGDVKFECSISISAFIVVTAGNITAGNIDARDIDAVNITAGNITAGDINAVNITAGDINAVNITAGNITAGDINAVNITAGDISFYAVCLAYSKFICKSIKGRRENSKYFSLDGEVEFKDTPAETIEIGGIKYSKSEVEKALKDIKAVE